MQLHTYLNYGGNCEQAFRFYEQHLGGKITMMMRHGEQPSGPPVPPDWRRAVLHARMDSATRSSWAPTFRRTASSQCAAPICRSRSTATRRPKPSVCAAVGRRTDLHADGGDVLRDTLRNAPRQVRHVVDAAPSQAEMSA